MTQTETSLAGLRGRPMAFLFRYIRLHPVGHGIVLAAVLLAVSCSVTTQFGMKHLIDVVAMGQQRGAPLVWGAFAILCALVAGDNLLWRVGGYTAHRTFVAITGDAEELVGDGEAEHAAGELLLGVDGKDVAADGFGFLGLVKVAVKFDLGDGFGDACFGDGLQLVFHGASLTGRF